MSQIYSEIEPSVYLQFERLQVMVGYIVCSEVGQQAYQGALDAAELSRRQDDLLTDDARDIAELFRDSERDARAKMVFGVESYWQLGAAQRLIDIIYLSPIAGSDSESRVIEATVDLQDKICLATEKNCTYIGNLTLNSYEVEFTDTRSLNTYSANCFGADGTSLDVRVQNPSLGVDSPFIVPKGRTRIDALNRIKLVLDMVEDQTVALIMSDGSETD
ncbi:MAG: hypothetical protein ABI220_03635 [Candidatus Saccharimonadales bacterium]